MMRIVSNARILLMLAALACIVAACSESPSKQEDGVTVSLQMVLPKAGGLDQLVDTVRLRIFAADLDTMAFGLPIIEGAVSMALDVPPGSDRIFEMDAVDIEGRVLYSGADTVDIGHGLDQRVHLLLRPVILLMRLSPLYQELSAGSTGRIDVWIHNVDSLFGAAFRLLYDPSRIQLNGSSAGEFLGSGDDILYFAKGVEEESYYSIGVSRLRQEDGARTGISGTGRLASISFTALVPSESEISLAIMSEKALSRPDGSAVDRIEELALDGAVVHVRGTE
ncbi:MAG: cohesin domain-containing protein [Candidatus Zixiibacteriota bacterium]